MKMKSELYYQALVGVGLMRYLLVPLPNLEIWPYSLERSTNFLVSVDWFLVTLIS